MEKVNLNQLKKLRTETSASIADCKKALVESNGDYDRALSWLRQHGIEKAEKKQDREATQGLIDSYIHQNGRVGVLLDISSETDFVAKTDEFKNLAHEVAMQIAAMNPKDVDTLLKQEYIRDGSQTIDSLVKGVIAKLGENIVINKFVRYEK